MTQGPSENVPTTLEGLIGFSRECGCGRTHSVELQLADLEPGALLRLPDVLRRLGAEDKVAVVSDRVTRTVAGTRAEELLRRDGRTVLSVTVPDGAGGRPHADEERLALVEAALEGVGFAVAVGAGTVNDLTKLAAFNRGIPYAVAATAPSMNGYASAIAAIMRRGVKRTEECHQPAAVIADPEILGRAPAHLIAAGLGDLESKPVSTADFRLSGMLRGTYYCDLPERVVFAAERRAADTAGGLLRGDPESVAALSEALILSGMSMKLAGSSSPASGGEHLISHFWDMTADEEGRVEGWHGAQVGVTTIVTSTLYERLSEVRPEELDVGEIVARRPSDDEVRAGIAARHGRRAQEVEAELFSKRLSAQEHRAQLERIVEAWDEIWAGLAPILRPPSRIRGILTSAGAPTTVTALGLTPDHLRRAYRAAREIRGRFTVLDLAAELCMLEETADEVLARSGCLG